MQVLKKSLKKVGSLSGEYLIVVDVHGESTSENGHRPLLDGKVTSVTGTPTHIPTSDLQIMSNGTFTKQI